MDHALASVFAPVRTPTMFEETVERLGTAIRLGLLAPGAQLPPERELADQLGISRTTLRQAITTLVQSGHVRSARGRGGGTFVAEAPPLAAAGPPPPADEWRAVLDLRIAVECGAAILACERATGADVARLRDAVAAMAGALDDFDAYRRADVTFHLAVAEATRAPRVVATMTQLQGEITALVAHIAHPPEVLRSSNAEHERLAGAIGRGDVARATKVLRRHLEGTEHILAGLLP